jgi:hypothetical protein
MRHDEKASHGHREMRWGILRDRAADLAPTGGAIFDWEAGEGATMSRESLGYSFKVSHHQHGEETAGPHREALRIKDELYRGLCT